MAFTIKDNISWVGKIDWELKRFHGDEYSTHKGSSYNAYLIRDDKNVLIDTVWRPFDEEFVHNLKAEIDLNKIDYIIANHGEVDHSGSLPELMKYIPDTPIYCTANAVKSIKGQYHQDWNFKVVKTGDRLNIGSRELIFIEAPMLHWPDTMFTYLTGSNILFSNDGFGQHYASEFMYNDLVDQTELYGEAMKYYANILLPFSKIVVRKIHEILDMKLPIDLICPSHGIIWRDNPQQIVESYLKWAQDYQENQISVIYDTMWNGTRLMAETIAQAIHAADPAVTVKVFNTSKHDKTDVMTEVFKSKTILVGSPTVNKGVLSSIAAVLEEIKGLGFKNKKAAAFGAYGWSGEAVKEITEILRKSKFEIINDGLNLLWTPDDEGIQACRAFAKQAAEK